MQCSQCSTEMEGKLVGSIGLAVCPECGRGEMISQPARSAVVRYSLPLAEVAPERGEQLHEAFADYMGKVAGYLAMVAMREGRV